MFDYIDNQSYINIATVNPLPFLFAESETFLKNKFTVNSLWCTCWESFQRYIHKHALTKGTDIQALVSLELTVKCVGKEHICTWHLRDT